ncbi:MAG: hypothetical protein CMI75_02490 [Candidatus Pelagibacter sp.]|nr:hypothetical protein [Candidatus Pelagibacter sp.]
MSIAKYIEAHYPQVLQFDIESINIDSKDIKDCWVKWAQLNIELKNGDVILVDNYHECDVDWKWADKVQAFDKHFNKVKLIEE